jgi:drug/metabolite transporter (DMT)-like permease
MSARASAADRRSRRVPRGAVAISAVAPRTAAARERRLAELGVLLVVALWSVNFVVVKAAVTSLGPLTFALARYLVACITLFLLIRWRLGPVVPPRRVVLALVGLGFIGVGGYQVLFTTGITMISAGDSSLIIAATPVLTVLLAGLVGLDRLTTPKLVGALIAFAGVALVVVASHEVTLGSSLAGDAMTLLAAVLWACYTVIGTRMLRQVDPLQATAWAVLGGTLVLVPFGIAELAVRPVPPVTPGAVAAVLFSGTLAAGVANVLVFHAIRLVGPSRVTAAQFLVPAGAVLLGAIFLAEPIGWPQVVGGLVIVAGVWLTRRPALVPAAVRGRFAGG